MVNQLNNAGEPEASVVTLASRVPPPFFEQVKRFAKKTKRTVSSAVYYLVESHPEFEKFVTDLEDADAEGNS